MRSLQSFSSEDLRQRARELADNDTADQWQSQGWKDHRAIIAELQRRETIADEVNNYQDGDDY